MENVRNVNKKRRKGRLRVKLKPSLLILLNILEWQSFVVKKVRQLLPGTTIIISPQTIHLPISSPHANHLPLLLLLE